MGVRGIWKAGVDGVPIAKFVKKVKSLDGKRICVDASNVIYAAVNADGSTEGTVLRHVLDVVSGLVEQVWVFDSGAGNPLKKRKKSVEREDRAEEDSRGIIHETKRLLGLMGIMYAVVPPGVEAEHLCAVLTKPDARGYRFCDYCMSADSDVLPYGGVMLKIPHTGPYEVVDVDVVLRGLGLDMTEFRKLCVLVGCDYCDRTLGPDITSKELKEAKLNAEQGAALAEYSKDITGEVDITSSKYDEAALSRFLTEKGVDVHEARSFLATMSSNI